MLTWLKNLFGGHRGPTIERHVTYDYRDLSPEAQKHFDDAFKSLRMCYDAADIRSQRPLKSGIEHLKEACCQKQ